MQPQHTILVGDVLAQLGTLEAGSVQCVVTSPPYWGLRDYGVEGQIGFEATPEAYVERLVAVFREVRRVLRDDGTVWLNLGDSYASSPPGNTTKGVSAKSTLHGIESDGYRETLDSGHATKRNTVVAGLKPKDLCGIPWRVALALQADGWWLRQDIIWAKPNPMPESVTDRCTKAHEYIFLLTKSARYFYDADAVREAHQDPERELNRPSRRDNCKSGFAAGVYHMAEGMPSMDRPMAGHANGRNLRSVWSITTQPYPDAHFATFPEAIPERCIKAGTSEKGCCPECGSPWVRVVEREQKRRDRPNEGVDVKTIGWQPGCECGDGNTAGFTPEGYPLNPIPCTVLDPFLGSGTTVAVANQLGRNGIGIELNPEYAEMARDRIGRATRPGTYRNTEKVAAAPLFAKAVEGEDTGGEA